jgi:hypothetical protein
LFNDQVWRNDVAKRPQNGPTFSKAPPKKKRPPMSDEELAALQARQNAALEETKRVAAATRRFSQLARLDPKAAIQELFPEATFQEPSSKPSPSFKRRRFS